MLKFNSFKNTPILKPQSEHAFKLDSCELLSNDIFLLTSYSKLKYKKNQIKMVIKKPTIVIDKEITISKITEMANKAKLSAARFRPHFKTHHSAEIGEWFRQAGVSSIAVSTLDMAEYFTQYNWKDIMICIPINILQIKEINDLAKRVNLHVLIDSIKVIEHVGKELNNNLNIWIEIDVGYKRTGISSEEIDKILRAAHLIQNQDKMHLKGILTHSGHAYHAHSIEEIKSIHAESIHRMRNIKRILNEGGFSNIEISIGDTPSCSIIQQFEEDIDEIRPGNFVFYDLAQFRIGSCSIEELSMTVACPIISKHSERSEVIIYGGGTSLGREFYVSKEGNKIYGLVCKGADDGHWTEPMENVFLSSLSQEHGKVIGPSEIIRQLKIGDILYVLPVHACQAATQHGHYQLTDGTILSKFRP